MVPLKGSLSFGQRVGVRAASQSDAKSPHPNRLPKGEGDRKGEGGRWCVWPLAPAAAVLAAALVYGRARLERSAAAEPASPPARIALIQGSFDIEMKSDPEMQQEIMNEYARLSRAAVQRYGRVDLVVWPETMFRIPLVTCDADAGTPEDWPESPAEFHKWLAEVTRAGPDAMAVMARRLRVALLLGVDAHHIGAAGIEQFNSAAFVARSGALVARYDKMHPVMFGEYVPLARHIGWLKRISPIGAGLTAGREGVEVEVGTLRVSPNICYESVLSHVVRRPIEMLAVECRKPFLIAANTGFSAHIDGDGRILALGPRHAAGTVLAEVRPDPRTSWYLRHGDLPAGICLAGCVVLAAVGCWPRHRGQSALGSTARV
jgi:apolipoprotein N-acyltransferase